MSIQAVLRENYGEFFTRNGVLNGIPVTDVTTSVNGEVHWRWEDEPDMIPLLLGTAKAGYALDVPFDTKGRQVRFFLRSQTENGQYDTNDLKQAVQTTFVVGGVALLSALTFSSGASHGTVANNGGTGTIRVLRRTGTNAFVEVANFASTTTSFTDTPPVNGVYDYELMQDGQDGASNVKTITATGIGSPTGSPPDTLTASYDGIDTSNLAWTNHGGTGSVNVERKDGSGGTFTTVASLSSSTTSYNDFVGPPDPHTNFIYYYRVNNDSVTGYSNEMEVFVPKA